MKTLITIITILFIAFQTLNAQQEKRLALVTSNVNSAKGDVEKPVSDALLIRETVENLDYGVI